MPKTEEIVSFLVRRKILYDTPEAKTAAMKAAIESVCHCQVTGAIGTAGAYAVLSLDAKLMNADKVLKS